MSGKQKWCCTNFNGKIWGTGGHNVSHLTDTGGEIRKLTPKETFNVPRLSQDL